MLSLLSRVYLCLLRGGELGLPRRQAGGLLVLMAVGLRHLLNVAVSRGRVGLVALGSPEAFDPRLSWFLWQVLKANRHWAAFLEHCRDLGGIIQDTDEPALSREAPQSADDRLVKAAKLLSQAIYIKLQYAYGVNQ